MNPFLAPLTPLAVRQGRRLLGSLEELPAPQGVPQGRVEVADAVGEELTLVVLGDATAAGIGADAHDQALAAGLASLLAAARGRGVLWQSVAEPGATSLRVHGRLLGLVGPTTETVVLSVGMGDLLARHTTAEWRTEMAAILDLVRKHPEVLVCGCPPMGRLSRLRFPMSTLLDQQARAFDDITEALCVERGMVFVSLRSLFTDPSQLARDGMHPSGAGYRHWAQLVADAATASDH